MKPEWEQMSLFTDEELGIKKSYNIIGLTGYAQSGKDTLASILIDRYGYRRVAFADTIREFLYEINPMVACSPTGYLKDLVNLVGWDKAKQEPQIRRLLQDLGVAARKLIDEDIWVTTALRNISSEDRVVITDVRFENEASKISALGGQLWRVKRPGVDAVNAHISETQMDGYQVDQIFLNNGTVDDLALLVQIRMQYAFSR
jgi:hypothetical protein